ncbi:MAG: GntR family transcriptional regulator [Fuerstiella sp.]|jgi:GntR family transcriptional regulator|nr:GntR family transcriptional regulator [Fuerstiella sp.]
MQIRISQDDGTPIDQQVVSQVTFRVSSGRLTAGEQLPTGRKLAEQLLINPNTVAQVCRELESAGVVISGRGSGVSVSDSGSPLSRREKNRILNESTHCWQKQYR